MNDDKIIVSIVGSINIITMGGWVSVYDVKTFAKTLILIKNKLY